MKLPQLRILATNFCGRRCVYCRPSGEGARCSENEKLDLGLVIKVAELYKRHGGTSIKITGGDPLYWDDVVKCIKILKEDIQIEDIELITRSPKIVDKIDDMIECGLDTLNFSLDTVNREKFKKITSVDDFEQLYEAIKVCAKKDIKCKLNTVVMKGINDDEIDEIVEFCEENNFHQLKLLDMISDLHMIDNNNAEFLQKGYNKELQDLYIPLVDVTKNIIKKSKKSEIVFQGGLGHPMNCYTMESGMQVIVKDAQNGAWYGSVCEKCAYHPCHDALMALRLTSDGKLQFCLLREDNCIDIKQLSDEELEEVFSSALNIYENAYFYEGTEGK